MTEIYLVEKNSMAYCYCRGNDRWGKKKKEYRSSMEVAKKLTRLLRYDEMVFFFFFFLLLSNVSFRLFHFTDSREILNVLLNVSLIEIYRTHINIFQEIVEKLKEFGKD